jgi:aspartate aminotransferase
MSQLLSERILNMATSATLAMAAKARELKAEGKDIIGLSLGEPDLTPQISLKTLQKQRLMTTTILIPL